MEEVDYSNSRISVEFNTVKQESQNHQIESGSSKLPSFHLQNLGDLCKSFGLSNIDNGLTNEQADANFKTYGPNIITPPHPNYFKKTIRLVFGGFNGYLWLGAVLAWIAWRPLSALVSFIIFSILINLNYRMVVFQILVI